MKIKKPSESSIKDTMALAGGGIAGVMGGRAVFGLLHNPATTTDTAQQKKDQNMALIKRGVLILASGALVASLQGNDAMTTLVKGAAMGVVIGQTGEVITTLAAKSGVANEASATTTGQKLLARAVGLGCPCNTVHGALGNPGMQIDRFDFQGSPRFAEYTPVNTSNPLEQWGNNSIAA